MDVKKTPVSFRANEADITILDYLKSKLGMGAASVIRLALRRLNDEEKRRDKK